MAATALGAFGSKARAAIPAIIDAFRDLPPGRIRPSPCGDDDRASFACALLAMDPAPIPVLLQALKHPNPRIRSGAAYVLQKNVGGDIKQTVPALSELLKDDAVFVRVDAALALWKVDQQADAAIPVLVEAMTRTKGEHHYIRMNASYGLEMIGKTEPKKLVQALMDLLKHEDSSVQRSAVEILKKLDPEAAAKAGVR